MKDNAPRYTGTTSGKPIHLFQERLIDIYWDKKNLEEFLPKIATYSSQQELVSITLAQLSIIEKQIIWLMQEMSDFEKLGGDVQPQTTAPDQSKSL